MSLQTCETNIISNPFADDPVQTQSPCNNAASQGHRHIILILENDTDITVLGIAFFGGAHVKRSLGTRLGLDTTNVME